MIGAPPSRHASAAWQTQLARPLSSHPLARSLSLTYSGLSCASCLPESVLIRRNAEQLTTIVGAAGPGERLHRSIWAIAGCSNRGPQRQAGAVGASWASQMVLTRPSLEARGLLRPVGWALRVTSSLEPLALVLKWAVDRGSSRATRRQRRMEQCPSGLEQNRQTQWTSAASSMGGS